MKRNIYSKRHPYYFATILAAFGVVFSIIAGTVNAIVSDHLKTKEPQKQIESLTKRQVELSDSLNSIVLDLKAERDSLTKHSHHDTIKK